MDALAADPPEAVRPAAEGWSPALPRIAELPCGEAVQDAPNWFAGPIGWDGNRSIGSRIRVMFLSRRLDERLLELFQKGYVKGTVTMGFGNEATAIGMSMPLRPGRDVVSVLHRDLGAHLMSGANPYRLLCQYLANADSPTHACEGNVHHGDAAARRFPMISHLGKMLSLVVGGTWAARRNGEQVFGLAVIGDGGTSTGEFHESLNIASVHKVPVLFLIENNHYAFSTPTSVQYNCRQLSDRAVGLRHFRPHDRRHRSLDGLLDGLRSDRRHGRVVVARPAGMRHASPLRSCRLRQGPVRSGRADGAVAEGRSRSPHAASPGGGLRP